MQQRRAAGPGCSSTRRRRRARREAQRWNLPGVISDTLDTEACDRLLLGDEWEPLMRRALAVAVEHGVHEQAGRAYTNLVSLLGEAHRPAEAAALISEGIAY